MIFLHGVRALAGEVLAVGGASGGAARFADVVISSPDTRTPLQRLLANPQSGAIRIDGSSPLSALVAPGAFGVADLDYRPDLVSDTAQITVTGSGGGMVRVRGAAGTLFFPTSGAPFTALVTLAPGFNDVDGVYGLLNSFGPDVFLVDTAAHPRRVRRILHLPGAVAAFGFVCTISPSPTTVIADGSLPLTATVTGTTQTAVSWSVDGGAANGTVTETGLYQAPCAAPAAPVIVRASSVLDPSKSGTATVTVIPGIAITSQAPVGTPTDATVPSANVGQSLAIAIPAAAQALAARFTAATQNVVFQTIARDANGVCQAGTATVAGTVAVGLTTLQATVPPCAAPTQSVHVVAHGCARLQIVPQITSLNRDPSLAPNMSINGSGFACGATDVYFGATKVAAAQILSVACNVILLGIRPTTGQPVTVRTPGGTSNAVT